VEFLTEIHGISSLLVAGIGIPLAGMIFLFISTVLSKKITVFKSWKLLLLASVFLAAAVFLWYDSAMVLDGIEGFGQQNSFYCTFTKLPGNIKTYNK